MKKIAIIGAGISGLLIANLFKKNPNYQINIYEKNTSVTLEEGYCVQLSVNSIKILNKIGIKTITTDSSIKIFGNPNLKINKKIVIKDYLKDHRVFMTSVIAAYVFGGTWNIHDKDSIKTSFPTFLDIINGLKK